MQQLWWLYLSKLMLCSLYSTGMFIKVLFSVYEMKNDRVLTMEEACQKLSEFRNGRYN